MTDIPTKRLLDQVPQFGDFTTLMQCDMSKIFGDRGALLFVDSLGLKTINDALGFEKGNLLIHMVGGLIYSEMIANNKNALGIYEGSGSFLVIVREGKEREVLEKAHHIKAMFQKKLDSFSGFSAGIDFTAIQYNEPVATPFSLLREGYRSLYASIAEIKDNLYDPARISGAIDRMYFRVNMALRLLDRHYEMATSDDVSGLRNHRAAEAFLEETHLFCQQTAKPYCILFFDGDNLRRYNELGYQKGNEMIAGLATLMLQSIRENDRIFRWLSGDEFLVVLKETDADEAMQVAERIRRAVEQETKNWHFPVTVSGGMACFPNDGESCTMLVNHAEAANSAAKKAGKNRVMHYCDILK